MNREPRAHPLVWALVMAAGFVAVILALFAGYMAARAVLPVIVLFGIPVLGAMAGQGVRSER